MRSVLVKVGGSLLSTPDLSDRLRTMLDAIPADRIMLLAGGGKSTDVVREWDAIFQLSTKASHWLAIDAMGVSARLLTELLPDVRLVADRSSANDPNFSPKTVILDPRPIIEEASLNEGQGLPVSWDCTSDSISAWIAGRWQVQSLVLAKSVDAPGDDASLEGRLSNTSQISAVDACFDSVVADDLPVYWCNVRTCPESIKLWKPSASRR